MLGQPLTINLVAAIVLAPVPYAFWHSKPVRTQRRYRFAGFWNADGSQVSLRSARRAARPVRARCMTVQMTAHATRMLFG